ncbi:cytochrome c [Psychrobacter ciconiae]|uniref:cytochrome c n=1 Tax=Psychrobacter ciconiae TaxID=1553449 RepID=UPI001919E22A|nr:cytochrome c [Psychrobacter ciconiae]
MKPTLKPLSIMLPLLALSMSSAVMAEGISLPNVSPANSDLVNKGAYVARAADCMACHGEDYKGGSPIATPMGDIYATNITPSKRFGIGKYTKQDLKRALTEGRAPTHRLYPAMPYPDYHGMTDADIDALFAYLQTVEPIDEPLEYKTKLPFPFNFRSLMIGWNLVNLTKTEPPKNLTEGQKRGQYLVDHLEHCGTCHTPRNSTMGADNNKYLAGAPLGSWFAPNITPDKDSGIGSWSEKDIITFLRTGELEGRAYAGGPMGEAVAHSTRYLTDTDLSAIAAYLKAVPAIQTDDKVHHVDSSRFLKPLNTSITHDLIAQKDVLQRAKDSAGDRNSPKALYLAACGSCHGVNGYAQPDAKYAPIVGLTSIRRERPDMLVNVIAHGVEGASNTSPSMPAFAKELNPEQIAKITNYVRVNFGGVDDSNVSAVDVERIMTAKPEQPFLIKYAGILASLGIIAVILIVGFIIWRLMRPRRAR